MGTHTTTLEIDNGAGVRSTDQLVVTVTDTSPPTLGTVIGHTVTAVDTNGNRSSASHRVDVVYGFHGFSAPKPRVTMAVDEIERDTERHPDQQPLP